MKRLADEYNLRLLRSQISERTGPRRIGGRKHLGLYAKLEPNDVQQLRPYHSDLHHSPAAFKLLITLRCGMYRTANRMHRLTGAGPQCRLCGVQCEDLEHVLLRCPRLAARQRALRDVVTAAAAGCATVAGLLRSRAHAERTFLALALGGDISHHDGLSGWLANSGRLAATRAAAISAAVPELQLLLQHRLELIVGGAGVPREWAGCHPYRELVEE